MRIDNYKDFKKFLESLDYKPKLLLHSCCGPCSSYSIILLKKYFDLDIFYSNDNIYPYEEFLYRLDEQKKVIDIIDSNINILSDEYNESDYYEIIKGLENLGEHSKRCYMCYYLRMEKTCKKAKEEGYEYFTTTLSISPYKNSDWINEIGYNLECKYNIKYLYSNFKKEEGYKKSIIFSKENDIYRQDYCGCVYSYNEKNK